MVPKLYLTNLLTLFSVAAAGFPPKPEGITTLKSKFHDGIIISYKEPGICETTPGVRSFAGYIHLPPNALNESHEHNLYPINTFFWFFEARKDPSHAPLTIWLNGGPGGSSLMGALVENGPCFVGNDSNSTYLNPWSWNNEVNMLYIDQPNQVGFSYDTLTNVTAHLTRERFEGWKYEPTSFLDDVPEGNLTFMTGTTGSMNTTYTANSTHHAAVAIWHFAQTWFTEFPYYKPADEQISLFTESYGGHYGPAFVSYFMHQNALIENGTLTGPGVHYLRMNTLGIVNGCIDMIEQVWSHATFAVNNTYGIKVFTDAEYYRSMYELTREDGIVDRIKACRRKQRELDRHGYGDIDEVDKYCLAAMGAGQNATSDIYISRRKAGWFDITHPAADPFPPLYNMGFLNQHWVQKALGVPVNFTFASSAVYQAFAMTGDHAKRGFVDDIAYILDHGVKVALLYGDRDYACNWVQGEATSLKIPWASQKEFATAGYTPLVISPVHSGGLTRQYGNLSFTRVYQAGHLVPSYQPETAYTIFMRALTGKDIATGTVDIQAVAARGEQHATAGLDNTWWMRSDLLPTTPRECYIWDTEKCSEEEQDWLFEGSAIVKDWIVVGRKNVDKPSHSLNDNAEQLLVADW
ncbi:hypothetical protein BAUCODRAFT_271525 [Baudoinia panamericana UAMH 10762]|uniref:Carboxypeptidase n=1 Tax=Baudoinia panamericana (strain UAMH 10762) TaxID=717646 RepID=M2N2Z4_BAUPA|nr:uncharacterized protein BAUCODRAFT_271525 [Baudoinia panamericana UAMH 10762]EMC93035.1 hypothetical protein BAUCODRAFT_271525 [Baudoinia panamericana UAMH 10762]